MGRDKALLRRRGRPWWRRQRDLLRTAGAGELILSARPDQRWALRAGGFAAIVRDPVPNGGPLAGIVAALEAAAHDRVAVLAIDLPNLPARWLAELAASASENRGVVGRRGRIFEPLAATPSVVASRRMSRAVCGRGNPASRVIAAGASAEWIGSNAKVADSAATAVSRARPRWPLMTPASKGSPAPRRRTSSTCRTRRSELGRGRPISPASKRTRFTRAGERA